MDLGQRVTQPGAGQPADLHRVTGVGQGVGVASLGVGGTRGQGGRGEQLGRGQGHPQPGGRRHRGDAGRAALVQGPPDAPHRTHHDEQIHQLGVAGGEREPTDHRGGRNGPPAVDPVGSDDRINGAEQPRRPGQDQDLFEEQHPNHDRPRADRDHRGQRGGRCQQAQTSADQPEHSRAEHDHMRRHQVNPGPVHLHPGERPLEGVQGGAVHVGHVADAAVDGVVPLGQSSLADCFGGDLQIRA